MLVAKERPTTNTHLTRWVDECAKMCKPDRIYWVDGSDDETKALTAEAVSDGVLIPLNETKRPRSFYSRSNPNDVARTEELTFVCTPTKEESGPTNNWMDPRDAYSKLAKLLEGSMRGRTMYVVPYVVGPLGSPISKVGGGSTNSNHLLLKM